MYSMKNILKKKLKIAYTTCYINNYKQLLELQVTTADETSICVKVNKH